MRVQVAVVAAATAFAAANARSAAVIVVVASVWPGKPEGRKCQAEIQNDEIRELYSYRTLIDTSTCREKK